MSIKHNGIRNNIKHRTSWLLGETDATFVARVCKFVYALQILKYQNIRLLYD